MIRSLVPPPEPKVALTLCLVAFSKAGIICSTAARMPPGAISVTSAARTVLLIATTEIGITAHRRNLFMVCLVDSHGQQKRETEPGIDHFAMYSKKFFTPISSQ